MTEDGGYKLDKCPYCGASIEIRDASYLSKNSDTGMFYVCSNYPKCNAYVGCYRNTILAMGSLANRALRNLRRDVHERFDYLWESRTLSRDNAYKWLAIRLGIPREKCHIGYFDDETCRKVIELCDNELSKLKKELEIEQ